MRNGFATLIFDEVFLSYTDCVYKSEGDSRLEFTNVSKREVSLIFN